MNYRYAMAVDLGTTTLAASLLHRGSGERCAFAGRANPQREFGADVVTRIQTACTAEHNRARLAVLINSAMADLAEELLAAAGASWTDLEVLAVAGNPTMEHLALKLPVNSLAHPPFRPLFTEGQWLRTGSLGWKQDLDAYFFPLPGGFVGGDLVAFLHYCLTQDSLPPSRLTPHTLYLDLGTNGEIALLSGDTIWSTSAAAGPAFEGGNLACGMPALPGAIDRVRFDGHRVVLSTIGNSPAAGICGSGVIEAISGMLGTGLLDATGRLRPAEEIDSNLGNRIVEVNGTRCFILHRDASRTVYLSQDDIRQVQLAKAAVRAGMEVLFQRAGINGSNLERVVLTGSFGAVLAAEWLKNIGIFTENMVQIADFVREGALLGVEKALSDPVGFAAVDDLGRRVRVIPLSGTPVFEKHFLQQMNFPAS